MKFRTVTAVLSLFLVAFLATGCKPKSDLGGAGTAVSNSATAADATGPTDCPTANTTSFAKTKFVLHTGLAFGAFHRYIYKPYKAGTFHSGAHGRITGFLKAGAAALFIKREVRLAYGDATANPTLCKAIASPLQAVGNKISDAVSQLKNGDSSGVDTIEHNIQNTETQSSNNGDTITEDPNAPLS